MRVARLLAALLVTVITLEQANSNQCDTACGWAGYGTGPGTSSGFYKDGVCGCVDWKPFDEWVYKRKLTLPSRAPSKGGLSKSAPPTTYSETYSNSW
jgi:hypothetical protein